MKKALQITKTALLWLIVATAIAMTVFTAIYANTLNQNDRGLFGFKFFIVRTDSMSATDFSAGDVIISKAVDVTTLKEGDIITFISEGSDSYGKTVTHKIREVTTDAEGDIAFITYGTTTGEDDEALATVVIGKYVGRIPKMGDFFLFLKTTPGYIICILMPFLILLISQAIDIAKLFKQRKREQEEEINAEREKLAMERAENQRIMAELLELKAQLLKKDSNEKTPAENEHE